MNICFIFALSSCAVSEKKWHESVSKLGGQSIYIAKDGAVSTRINNKVSNNPNLNIFDAESADSGYGALQMLYSQYGLEYKNKPDYNSVYILDMRNNRKSIGEYNKIINKEKNK